MTRVAHRTLRQIIILGTVLLLSYPSATAAESRFPEIVAKSVVSLGMQNPQGKWTSVGTGFLMRNDSGQTTVLVTCRHIVEPEVEPGVKSKISGIWVKVDSSPFADEQYGDPRKKGWLTCQVTLLSGGSTLWTGHPDESVDIAVFDFPPNDSLQGLMRQLSDTKYIPLSFLGDVDSLCLAQDVLFFGFPLGLGDEGNPQPLVRSGIISYLDPTEKTFILDAQVFGGSSGSPVVSTGTARGDPPLMKRRRLLGIISGYRYSAIRFGSVERGGSRSGMDTIRFPVENAGLGTVFSSDLILETIDAHNRRSHAKGNDSSATPANH